MVWYQEKNKGGYQVASAKKLARQLELLEKFGFELHSTMNQFELLTARPRVSCFGNNAILDFTTHTRSGAGAITTDGKTWSRKTALTDSEIRQFKDADMVDTTDMTKKFNDQFFKPRTVH